MNYKLTTALLAIVVVALLAKDYFKPEDDKPDAATSLQDPCRPIFEPNTIDFGDLYSRKPEEIGKFILTDDARFMISDYHNQQSSIFKGYDPTKALYGFTFGIEKVDSLMYRINEYQKENKDTAKRITGIRVYYGVKIKNGEKYNDVFMLPILGDSLKNFYAIDENHPVVPENESMILNGSLPCPFFCDPKPE